MDEKSTMGEREREHTREHAEPVDGGVYTMPIVPDIPVIPESPNRSGGANLSPSVSS